MQKQNHVLSRSFYSYLIIFCSFITLALSAASAHSGEVMLEWDPNTEPDLAGYKVYYGTASEEYQQHVDVGSYTGCTISGLDEDRTYYFAATAYGSDGIESGFSSEISQYVPKADTDTDGDGLTDADETNVYGTDPDNADSDGDGLSDGDEINVYFTDPNNADTDGDGISDGDEINSEIIEAESGDLTSPMQIVSDTEASGGSYIETTQAESGTAVYTVNIDNPGLYKITARVYTPDAGSDSFYVSIDDQEEFIWDLNPSASPEEFGVWRDDEITNRGNGTFDSPEYNPYTVELGQGTHTLTIRGRETSVKLDYFSFEKVGDIPVPVIEAESGDLTSPMQITADTEASGESYIETTQADSGTAVYTFDIDNPGLYKIIARVYTPDASSDSFYVSIDDQEEFVWDLNPSANPDEFGIWRDDEITNRGNGTFDNPEYDPYTVELEQGTHTLTIRGRESSTRLDYIYSEKVGDIPMPVIEAESGDLTLPMESVSDTEASGGSYIETTQAESGTAVYSFNIDNPGIYKIIARVYAPDVSSDSFYVSIDDQEEFIWDLNPSASPDEFGVWRDDEITNRGNGTFDNPQYDPHTVELDQGTHTFIIRGREGAARLDCIRFEKAGSN